MYYFLLFGSVLTAILNINIIYLFNYNHGSKPIYTVQKTVRI